MPNRPTAGGVFLPNNLNACNSPSQTGAQDPITGNPIPTGLNPWKVWTLSFAEAQAQQAPSPSIEQCFEGDYMWVQVDSGATVAEVQTGMPAYYKLSALNNSVNPILTVTGYTGKTAQNFFAGVFLNPITPGNWGVIFNGGGRVNVVYASSLTNGAPAIGDVIATKAAAGGFDDAHATTTNSYSVGVALVQPVANGTSQVYMKQSFPRIGGGN